MIVVVGSVQAEVRIDMTMPKAVVFRPGSGKLTGKEAGSGACR